MDGTTVYSPNTEYSGLDGLIAFVCFSSSPSSSSAASKLTVGRGVAKIDIL